MLRSTYDLEGFSVDATDGPVGHVRDFYFDDNAWVVRYLIVDTGNWLSGREVLISPISVDHMDWAQKRISVFLTRKQVKHSPDIDTKKPVSRQHELEYLRYYRYPSYYGGLGLWGDGFYPSVMRPDSAGSADAKESGSATDNAHTSAQHPGDDPRLRSCRAVVNYHIHATDGDIGRVQGLLIDEQTWAIRYAILKTSHWWLGHQVLIAPQWIQNVSWQEATVSVDLTRQAIKDAPAYDPAAPLDRNYEIGLYRHYGRRGYWADKVTREDKLSHA